MEKIDLVCIGVIIIITLLALLMVTTYYNNFGKWQFIALENAWHRPYEIHVYDCDNFSEDLVKKLNSAGFDSEMVVSYDVTIGICTKGYAKFYETLLGRTPFCHAWVVINNPDGTIIPIEATTGLPMSIEQHNIYMYGEEK